MSRFRVCPKYPMLATVGASLSFRIPGCRFSGDPLPPASPPEAGGIFLSNAVTLTMSSHSAATEPHPLFDRGAGYSTAAGPRPHSPWRPGAALRQRWLDADHPARAAASAGTCDGVVTFKFRDPEGHPLELLEFPPGNMPAAWRRRQGVGPCLGNDHSFSCS
jgi:hypothetical protein